MRDPARDDEKPRNALFSDAIFSGDARFSDTTFSRAAWFGQATFSRAAQFGDATFSGDARFGEEPPGGEGFGGASLEAEVDMASATRGGCRQTACATAGLADRAF